MCILNSVFLKNHLFAVEFSSFFLLKVLLYLFLVCFLKIVIPV